MSQCMKHIAFDLCIKKVLVQDGKIEKKEDKKHFATGKVSL